MKYVSIDIETTGLEPNFHQMIEFAAVIEDTENLFPICQLPSFRALIKQDPYTISPFCLRLNAKLLDELTLFQKKHPKSWFTWDEEKQTYLCMEDALPHLFMSWLKKNSISTEHKITVAGKNFYGFDFKFIDPIMKGRVRFHHRALDPYTIYKTRRHRTPEFGQVRRTCRN